MGRVTLQSVADHVGVSRMTVSNAFSRPDQLSTALRERILAAAAELGYAGPDPTARGLATGATGTVGVLWTGRLRDALTDEISARFLGAVADELAPRGVSITLLSPDTSREVIAARDVAMDGAIVYSAHPDSPALEWLHRRGMPLVYVDTDAPVGVPVVDVDDRGGARLAAEHVLALGHRRIGLLTTGISSTVALVEEDDAVSASASLRAARERLAGWSAALHEAGASVTIAAAPNIYEDARPSADLLLDAGVTAVLCASDVLARDVVEAARARGLVVPNDLSVVGFDDHPVATRMHPGLTTVRQEVTVKGRAAANGLLASIAAAKDPDAPGAADVHLTVHLVERGSTARPSR